MKRCCNNCHYWIADECRFHAEVGIRVHHPSSYSCDHFKQFEPSPIILKQKAPEIAFDVLDFTQRQLSKHNEMWSELSKKTGLCVEDLMKVVKIEYEADASDPTKFTLKFVPKKV